MTMRATRGGRGERGLALVAVLLVLVLLMGIAGAFHGGVISETALRGSHARATAGFYAAEAGINRGMGDYRNIFNSYNIPTGHDFDMHTFTLGPRTISYQLTDPGNNPKTRTIPPGKPFAYLNAIEYQYTANGTSSSHSGDIEASIGTEFDVDYVPLFQFLAFYQGDLEILPGPTMTLHGPIHTNGNLYFNSNTSCAGGPPCSGGLTIAELQPTIPTVHVTSAGDIYRERKDTTATCSGTVQVASLADANADNVLDLKTMPCSGLQSSAQLSGWLGSVKAHQPVVAVPQPGDIARGGAKFWAPAQLRIVLDLQSGDSQGRFPIVAQNVDGSTNGAQNALLQAFIAAKPGRLFYSDKPVSQSVHTDSCHVGDYCDKASYAPAFGALEQVYGCAGSDLGLYTGCPGAGPNGSEVLFDGPFLGKVTSRRGGFYDWREAKWVYMLNLNLRDLLVWNALQPVGAQLFDPNDRTNGGIVIFLSVKGPHSAMDPHSVAFNDRYAVRVLGSPNLGWGLWAANSDPTGATVISDQSFYVEGDYNKGDAANSKMPAAVIGDTIHVLSNHWSSHSWGNPAGCLAGCWNDCQSAQNLVSGGGSCRPASNTTVYSAFLAGVDLTTLNGGNGLYNGGLENYPRFLESWSGLTLTYRGSFVSLGLPQHNSGLWCGTGNPCGIYDPPGNRNWDYDTDFQNVAWLPPLTPRVVSVQQIVFTENFR